MSEMRETPLASWHRSHGAKMAPFAGWDMPIQYEGILAEHNHTRSAASVFDICHMGQFMLEGEGAAEKLARAVLKSGSRRIDGVFLSTASAREQKGLEELQALLPVGQVFRPFAGHNWPGETAVFGPTRVTAQWGLHARKDGGTWRTRGYAGTGKESLSYQIEYAGAKVQTGSCNYWVQTPSGALRSEQNKTVFARI